MVEIKNAYQVSFRIPEGKTLFRRPMSRWEENIKLELKIIMWTGVIWFRIGFSGGLL
jgi:hypothetical protein